VIFARSVKSVRACEVGDGREQSARCGREIRAGRDPKHRRVRALSASVALPSARIAGAERTWFCVQIDGSVGADEDADFTLGFPFEAVGAALGARDYAASFDLFGSGGATSVASFAGRLRVIASAENTCERDNSNNKRLKLEPFPDTVEL
jgi:hypothetical protein